MSRKPSSPPPMPAPTDEWRVTITACTGGGWEMKASEVGSGIEGARQMAADKFRRWLEHQTPDYRDGWLRPLRGKDLACWCPLEDADGNPVPCHADVLLELANQGEER